MNLKRFSRTCLLSALCANTLPVMAQTEVSGEGYSSGTPLDIDQVISLAEDSSPACGLVNARITYLDSMGDQRVLAYLKQASACSNEGG
jgi:hypothetical protein